MHFKPVFQSVSWQNQSNYTDANMDMLHNVPSSSKNEANKIATYNLDITYANLQWE